MKKLPFLFLLVFTSLSYAQHKSNKQDFQVSGRNDFRIISSDNSSVIIDYYPDYTSIYGFRNSARNSPQGMPDVGSRCFPLFLPVPENNRIEILDSKFVEIKDAEVPPVSSLKKEKIGYSLERKKDPQVYSKDEYYPPETGKINESGIIRNKYSGVAVINPVQFNPVKKIIRKYSYIRFKITFGRKPVYSDKQLSKEEYSLLFNSAVNSAKAINWSTKDFNKDKRKIQNSVLATGDFYKIEVKENGIYIIDKNFLQSAGINISSIDPRTIKIYNNGGKELPYDNAEFAPDDLIENRIYVEGEGDGKFDDNDYILFYGSSPHKWNYMYESAEKYRHSIHKYSNSNIYFVTFGGVYGRRMQSVNSPEIPNVQPVPGFSEKLFIDPDINNLGSTGILWLSQRISTGESFVINRTLYGYEAGSDINYRVRLGNASSLGLDNAIYRLSDDNSYFSVLLLPIPPVAGDFSKINLNIFEGAYSLKSGLNSIQLKMSLPLLSNSNTISGYYDWVEIFYRKSFNNVENNSFHFTSLDSTGVAEFDISGFSSGTIKIFDVTDFNEVSLINPVTYSGGVVKFQQQCIMRNPREYFVIGGKNYLKPVSISSKLQNQNLHGYADGYSFIILSPSEFLSAANRLKAVREAPGQGNPNYLKTGVFDINQIYNEFSCGIRDPMAVRNFLKYAYNMWLERPVYVLFLGDGNYDYKNIYNLNVNNYLPAIEKPSATSSDIESYTSDDFYTDINESYPEPTKCHPDFASGRICVNSLSEANTVIDKIIQYESSESIGIWKKKNMYVADDGWTPTENNGNRFVMNSEDIAEFCTPQDFEKEKIYIVSYPTVITPQGRTKPGANEDIIKGWNEGRLLINYIGHGSADLWAHEQIFVRDKGIPRLNNKFHYPFIFMGSCDLSRWDDPFSVSMSEQLLNIENKGVIADIGATRPVYADFNAFLNHNLHQILLFNKDTLNLPARIGKAFFTVKNINTLDDNDSKYSLLGDPTLRINIPQHITQIDSINGITGEDTAVIKALQKVVITGSVLKPDSTFWGDYNGELNMKIQDVSKNIHIEDFGTDFDYIVDGGTIFRGKTNISNGKWKIQFVVPKDISYNSGNGKMLAYFKNSNTEGSGYTDRFIMNGLDTAAAVDSAGPVITLYMDSRNFRSGDLINQNSKIIADFYDENGLNLTGTIGHKIEAVINDRIDKKIDLTSYYNVTSGYQYGTLEYQLQDLAEGKYNLKIRAWDTYNNFSESSTDFYVKANTALVLEKVYNYPNPMKDFTTFVFQHNFDSPLNVNIRIYTVRGVIIKEIKREGISDKYVNIDWDGKDNDGDFIANGTYLYKVLIKTQDGSYSNSVTGKLARLK